MIHCIQSINFALLSQPPHSITTFLYTQNCNSNKLQNYFNLTYIFTFIKTSQRARRKFPRAVIYFETGVGEFRPMFARPFRSEYHCILTASFGTAIYSYKRVLGEATRAVTLHCWTTFNSDAVPKLLRFTLFVYVYLGWVSVFMYSYLTRALTRGNLNHLISKLFGLFRITVSC